MPSHICAYFAGRADESVWEYAAIGGEEYVVCPFFFFSCLWWNMESLRIGGGRGKKDDGGCYLGVCACVCVYVSTI